MHVNKTLDDAVKLKRRRAKGTIVNAYKCRTTSNKNTELSLYTHVTNSINYNKSLNRRILDRLAQAWAAIYPNASPRYQRSKPMNYK